MKLVKLAGKLGDTARTNLFPNLPRLPEQRSGRVGLLHTLITYSVARKYVKRLMGTYSPVYPRAIGGKS